MPLSILRPISDQRQEKIFSSNPMCFFNSQEVDRVKDLSNANYTNEELYIPIILKSSSSRLIIRSVLSAPKDEGFDNRTFLLWYLQPACG